MRILISDDLSPEAKTILERIPGVQVDFKVGLKPPSCARSSLATTRSPSAALPR